MNFENGQEIMVYSNENGYCTRLSRKNKDDEWESAFLFLNFKKGVSVLNKTKIKILDSWLTFYKSKEGKTVLYCFVSDFDVVE